MSDKKPKVKTTVVSYEDIKELENDYEEGSGFRPPSKWYVLTATGDHLYFHCRSRETAQAASDYSFGGPKYTVRPSSLTGGRAGITAK